jgi:hypothetical protein
VARDPRSELYFFEKQNRFHGLNQADQVTRAAWYLQAIKGLSRFEPKDLTAFFNALHLEPPNVHVNVKRLCERKPRVLLCDKAGYYLEGNAKHRLDGMLNLRSPETVTHITSESLKDIASKISESAQRTFLAETLSCYRAGAFRATIVMAWSLAFDHFQGWVLRDGNALAAFNQSSCIKYPKKAVIVRHTDDFAGLREFEAIEVAQHAKLLTKHVAEIMKEKLKRRNAAAHPSTVTFTQAQADDMITDLVHNVIAKMN